MTAVADPIVLVVHGVPTGAGSKTAYRNKHTGRIQLVDGGSKQAKADRAEWRRAVTDAARRHLERHPAPPLAEPLAVECHFRFPLPAGDAYRTLHQSFPDADHLVRAVGDCLTQSGLIKDDKHIWRLVVEKRYCRAGVPAGATVIVQPMGEWEQAQRERLKAEAAQARRRRSVEPAAEQPTLAITSA